MPVLLVMLFVLVPLVEIYLVLQVGAAIGAWWTIALLIVDSLIGAWLLKVEGRRAWSQFRTALADGRWPGDEVAQGALVIVGGTLLLTPGFLTDAAGLLMLLGPTRRLLSGFLRSRISVSTSTGRVDGTARPTASSADVGIEVVEIEREQRPPVEPEDGGSGDDGRRR